MGQYYVFANLDKQEYLNPFAFKTGLKLLASCYSDNGYIEAMVTYLTHEWKDDTIIYCGDYAWSWAQEHQQDRNPTYRQFAAQFASIFQKMRLKADPYAAAEEFTDISAQCGWAYAPDNWTWIEPASPQTNRPFYKEPTPYRYVINNTTQEYVDLYKEPIAAIKKLDADTYSISRWHSLPLLLAIGNGLGGGDFLNDEDNPTLDNGSSWVGSWAGDAVTLTNDIDLHYKDFGNRFDQAGVFLTAPDEEILACMRTLDYPIGANLEREALKTVAAALA